MTTCPTCTGDRVFAAYFTRLPPFRFGIVERAGQVAEQDPQGHKREHADHSREKGNYVLFDGSDRAPGIDRFPHKTGRSHEGRSSRFSRLHRSHRLSADSRFPSFAHHLFFLRVGTLALFLFLGKGDPQFRGARPAVTDFAEKRVLQSAATAPTGIRHLHFPPSFVHGGEGPPGPASGPVPGHTPGGSSCPG